MAASIFGDGNIPRFYQKILSAKKKIFKLIQLRNYRAIL